MCRWCSPLRRQGLRRAVRTSSSSPHSAFVGSTRLDAKSVQAVGETVNVQGGGDPESSSQQSPATPPSCRTALRDRAFRSALSRIYALNGPVAVGVAHLCRWLVVRQNLPMASSPFIMGIRMSMNNILLLLLQFLQCFLSINCFGHFHSSVC